MGYETPTRTMVAIATAGGALPKPMRPTGPRKNPSGRPAGCGGALGPAPAYARRRQDRSRPARDTRASAMATIVAMNRPVSGQLHGHVQPMGTESAHDRRGVGSWFGPPAGRRARFVWDPEAGPT